MKRKLDDNDVPAPVVSVSGKGTDSTFADLGLDARLLQAIAQHNFHKPTPVQSKAIPLALSGKDVLARARTGSGKTAAYLLPIVHFILNGKRTSAIGNGISALILVPTRELADQVLKELDSFIVFCAKDIRAISLTQRISDAVQRSLLADCPDIIVATPARASTNVNSGALNLMSLSHLVIDEADLVLSYGYEEDLMNVARNVSKEVQTMMMSATLTTEVDTLKSLFCRDPATLELEEPEADGEGITQYVVKCAEDEKFLLIYIIFKLKLIKGKCIIFVGDVDRSYRLKLFLEQFGTKSCILNSELPLNSRIHVVEEFNKNVYEIIIASDELEVIGDVDETKTDFGNPTTLVHGEISKKKRKLAKKDKEYGVSRGIDFKNVACVLNFDLPTSSTSYTHRIGRTARVGQSGMALSFVISSDQYRKHKTISINSTKDDEKVLAKIIKSQAKKGKEVKPFNFDMKQIDAFRYRLGDALRAVTGAAIREARTRELRQELIKSDKLKRHFEENPGDLHHLRHDGELRPARVQAHLKHVPDYLLPKEGKKAITGNENAFIGRERTDENRIRKARMAKRMKGGRRKTTNRKIDPLKTFRGKTRD